MKPVIVFDSGVGGLTVVAAIRRQLPDQSLVFVADDAWFPYGPRPDGDIIARVDEVIGRMMDRMDPAAVVIACNTASTLVLEPLRAKYKIPIVGTVPAVKPAAEQTRSGVIAVLATDGTIRRDYTRALIDEYAKTCHVRLVGSAMLASYAESELRGEPVADGAIRAEIRPAFVELEQGRTDQIVLACTHYPLLLDRFRRLEQWPVNWIDPSPAIARRLGDIVGKEDGTFEGHAIRTSGRPWPNPVVNHLQELGLMPVAGKRGV